MRNSKFYWGIYLGVAILSFLYVIGSFMVPSTRVVEYYFDRPLEIEPTSRTVLDSGLVIYRLHVPVGEKGRTLEFLSSHQQVKVYADDRLIYEVDVDPSIFGKTPGTQVNYVRLADNDRVIRVECTPIYSTMIADNISFRLSYGLKDMRNVLTTSLLIVLVCFCCLLSGVFCIFLYLVLGRGNKRFTMLCYFGMFVTLMGTWLINETKFMSALITNRGAASLVSYLSIGLIPVPFVLFHRRFLNLKPMLFEKGIYAYSVVVLVVRLFLHMTGIMDFRVTNNFGLAALILSVLYVLIGTIIHTYQHGLDQAAALCIFAILAFILTLGNNLISFMAGRMQTDFAGRTVLLVYVLYMIVISCKDVYKQLQENERMNFYKKLAVTDIMTGFRNRAAYEGWEKSIQDYEDIMYVLLDLNDLKQCNDNFGHNAGDVYIKDAAQIIKEVFGGIGECYRIGGDEFCVTIIQSSQVDVEEYVAQLREKEAEYNRNSTTVQIHMALGYSAYRPYDEDFGRTRKRADQEMYKNKAKLKEIYGGSL